MSAKFEEIWMASATLQGLLWELKQNNGENIDLLRPEISDLLSKINAAVEIEPETSLTSASETVIPTEEPQAVSDSITVSDSSENETEDESIIIEEQETEEQEEAIEEPEQLPAVSVPENESADEEITLTATRETATEVLSVDEKLSRKVSGDIRKAFSLNDKFLYRRELFGNSAQQYDAALDLIAEMDGYEDAETYFLDNYGWDKEDVHVKNFMKILYNHFKSIQ